jgi:Cytochrome c
MIRSVFGRMAVLGLFSFIVGCHKTSPPTSSPGPPPGPAMASAGPGGQGEFDAESGPHAAGKKALVANGCFRCHMVNGVRGPVGGGGPPMMGGPPGGDGGGPPMGGGGPPGPGGRGGPGGPGGRPRAPDLGQVAKDPEHTADWIARFVRSPRAVKPDSKGMPNYEGKIQDSDLKALADYLVSLK